MSGYSVEDKRRVRVGSALIIVGALWMAAFKALGFVLRALFGGDAFGVFAVAQGVIELLGFLLLGGFSDAIVRHGSRFVHGDEKSLPDADNRLYDAIATCILTPLAMSVVLAATIQFSISAVYSAIWTQHSPVMVEMMRTLSWMLPLLVLVHLPVEATKVHLQFRWSVLTMQIAFPTLSLVSTLLLHQLTGGGILSLAYGVLSGLTLCLPLSFYAFTRHYSMRKLADAVLRMRLDRDALSFGSQQSVNMLLNQGLNRIDTLLLSYFVSSNAVGIYSLVAELVQTIRMSKMAFSGAFSPLISKYVAMKNHAGIRESLNSVARVTGAIGFPIFLIVVSIYESIVIRGTETWTESRFFPWILCTGPLMSASFGLASNVLLMSGHTRLMMLNAFVSGLVSVGLNLLLIPKFGVLGAAIGTACSHLTISLLQIFELARLERVTFSRTVHLNSLIALSVSLPIAIIASTPQLREGIHATKFLGPRPLSFSLAGLAVLVYAVVLLTVDAELRQNLKRFLQTTVLSKLRASSV
jgi:O-antigen/teichoic acid export membrane protein